MMSALPAHRFVAAVIVAILILVLAPFAFAHINRDDNGEGDRIKNRVFSVTVGVRLR